MANYKTCAVPLCRSTTIKTPNKLFIHVPKCPKRRKQWLQLARRNQELTSDKSAIFFCEDHFDLPNDMENYIQYNVMGSVGKIRMKPDCLPLKFQCQPDRIKRTAPPQPRSAVSKRRRMQVILEMVSKQNEMPATSGITSNNDFLSATEKNQSSNLQDQATQLCPEITKQQSPEITKSAKIRSKYVQTSLKTQITNTATSPFKITSVVESAVNMKIKRKLLFSKKLETSSLNSLSPKHSQLNTNTSPSVQSLVTMTSTSSDQETQSELSEIKRKIEAENLCRISVENTLRLIKNNPQYYIGILKECYFLTEIIKKHTKLPENHILLCLNKIRLNTPFSELGDQFGMSKSYASKVFKKSVALIASELHAFLFKLNKRSVKQNLPMTFRHKYNDIFCIIDCFEIEIQKPSKSVEQVLTWSEYKKANTAKYLISITPDGIINYISPGYSGRTTDVLLVKNCSFLDCLEPGVSILADRGFKNIEEILQQKGINLVRPPSVASNSKQDVIKTKQIANLRIQKDRVLWHLREFSMFKPHSVVKKKLLKYLDESVIIACALINLQMVKNT